MVTFLVFLGLFVSMVSFDEFLDGLPRPFLGESSNFEVVTAEVDRDFFLGVCLAKRYLEFQAHPSII